MQCLAFFLKRGTARESYPRHFSRVFTVTFYAPFQWTTPQPVCALASSCAPQAPHMRTQGSQTLSVQGQGGITWASSWEQIFTDTGWQQVSSPHVSKGKSPISSCLCSKFPTGFPKYQSTSAYTGGKHCSGLLFIFLAFCSLLYICSWHLANDHRNPNCQTISKMERKQRSFLTSFIFWSIGVFHPSSSFSHLPTKRQVGIGWLCVLDVNSAEICTLLQLPKAHLLLLSDLSYTYTITHCSRQTTFLNSFRAILLTKA